MTRVVEVGVQVPRRARANADSPSLYDSLNNEVLRGRRTAVDNK